MALRKVKTFQVAVHIEELGERTHVALEKMPTQKWPQNAISLHNGLTTEDLFLQLSLQRLRDVGFFQIPNIKIKF